VDAYSVKTLAGAPATEIVNKGLRATAPPLAPMAGLVDHVSPTSASKLSNRSKQQIAMVGTLLLCKSDTAQMNEVPCIL
jgi:hypothetical protein